MRRPTLYKHRGAWYARFWNEQEGKYHSRALGVPVEGKKERRREAEEAASKIAAETAQKAAAPAVIQNVSSVPLVKYVLDFWQPDGEYAREKALLEKKALSKHYLLTNQCMVETKMKPFPGFAGITLNSLTKPVIRQWKLWLAEQGYSGRVINGAMQALRVPVKRAFADDIIPADPFAGVPRAAHKEKIRGVLTPAEIKKLVETPITDPRQRLAVLLPLFCGLRMGEVRALQFSNILDGIIHITKNWQEKEGLKAPKCGSEGYVPMPRIIAELLNEVYKIAPLTGPEDFVMAIKPNGSPICREYLSQSLRNELALIGIDENERKERNIVYHSLRHSCATLSQIIGLSAFQTLAITRHRDTKMLDRYTHRDALDMRTLVGKFDQFTG